MTRRGPLQLDPNVIPNGSTVQYRKVGKAVVRFHQCPDGYHADGTAHTSHRYLVHFFTGRYAREERHSQTIWLAADAITERMDPFAGLPGDGR